MTDNERKELLMKAKPILFNTDMVRAILDGRKTVTRRVVKPQPREIYHGGTLFEDDDALVALVESQNGRLEQNVSPYRPGDILYVRETWAKMECNECSEDSYDCESAVERDGLTVFCDGEMYVYKATDLLPDGIKWHPSIHMPKEAARIFLRVTDVRAERLQDITEAQAMAEGVFLDSPDFIPTYHYSKDKCDIPGKGWNTAKECFQWGLWGNTIKKSDLDKYGWNANPWVWVIEFETKGLIENENQN